MKSTRNLLAKFMAIFLSDFQLKFQNVYLLNSGNGA